MHIHHNKSPNCDHIYNLCLYMLEEHNSSVLTSEPVPKLRYSAHARKYKPLLHCIESSKSDNIEMFCL